MVFLSHSQGNPIGSKTPKLKPLNFRAPVHSWDNLLKKKISKLKHNAKIREPMFQNFLQYWHNREPTFQDLNSSYINYFQNYSFSGFLQKKIAQPLDLDNGRGGGSLN